MDIEHKLRELLMPILGISSIDQIQPESALVKDLNAESIDFVEILYVIETELGVKIHIQEITMVEYGTDVIPSNSVLTAELAQRLNNDFQTNRFQEGQTVRDIFDNFTVRDLATVIKKKMNT